MTARGAELSAPPPISGLEVRAYTIPTNLPESDGTLEWNSTTIIVVQARAAGEVGIGYSYTHRAAAELIRDVLAEAVTGRDSMDAFLGGAMLLAAVGLAVASRAALNRN